MRKFTLAQIIGACSVVIVAVLAPCAAASAATLVLKDGTVIHGEIESLQGDTYTVKTDSLGTVRLRKQNVRTIDHSGGSAMASSSTGAPPGQVELQAMQTRMMRNPDLIAMIQALQSDPEMQAVLADPQIMNALASGDYAALKNNPKIISLMRNAKVRAVVGEVR